MGEIISGFEEVSNIDGELYHFILHLNIIVLILDFTTNVRGRGIHKDNVIS